jgi:hypothetical protein
LRPHFIDRWKKQQKKDANELDHVDPFFNDVTGVSDDESPADRDTTTGKRTRATTVGAIVVHVRRRQSPCETIPSEE